jgi:putative nucleotidyltransferase with HDIG domain
MTESQRPGGRRARPGDAMASQLIEELAAAFTNSSVYSIAHRRVEDALERVVACVAELCKVTGQDSQIFGLTREHVVYATRPLLGASLGAGRLLRALGSLGVAGFCISQRARVEDLSALLELIGDEQIEGFVEMDTALRARAPSASVQVLRSGGVEPEDEDASFVQHLPVALYQSVVESLESLTVSISTGGTIDFSSVETQAEGVLQQLRSGEAGILQLAKQQQYDAFTFAHSVRVTTLALNFARQLTDDEGILVRIGTAALLHDVGKSRVPFELLQSRKPLTMEERQEIMKHPEYGAEILMGHSDCDPCALAACYGHHLSVDGKGYPKHEHDATTSVVTRIIAIVDIYEALTAQRPYKKAMSPVRAFRILMDMRERLDARLLQRFIACTGIYPSGSYVRLSDGRVGRVERQGAKVQEPVVRICAEAEHEPVPVSDPLDLELGSHPELAVAELIERA